MTFFNSNFWKIATFLLQVYIAFFSQNSFTINNERPSDAEIKTTQSAPVSTQSNPPSVNIQSGGGCGV